MLGRREVDFLDKVGKDALFTTGHKLSYNDILRALIGFAMDTGISGEGVNSWESFKKSLLVQLSGVKTKKGGSL
ncbi:MAG: hypothetical protein PHO34_04880 [Candidatus Omnitrophica bacterium]|nr:hypothetical protein [Candidatus Omnitrophota bacterium]